MDLEPFLSALDNDDELEPQKTIRRILKDGLLSPGETSDKASKIANELQHLFSQTRDRNDLDDHFWNLVTSLVDIVYFVPPDHPWQDTLVQTVAAIRKLDEPLNTTTPENAGLLWKDIPQLGMYIRDVWLDPTTNRDKPTDVTEADVAPWKNLNSFAARIVSSEFQSWVSLAVWELRSGLEEGLPHGKGGQQYHPVSVDSRIWVATEWILRCGQVIYGLMSSSEEISADTARSFRLGTRCSGVGVVSLERWGFWKERLQEIYSESGTLPIKAATVERIARSLEKMKEIEGK